MRTTKAQKIAANKARAERNSADLSIVATGCCPRCGTKLVQNLSFFFWWQCGAFGDLRRAGFESLPKCSWQSTVLDRDSYLEANEVLVAANR